MSQETTVDQIDSCDNTESYIILYCNRLVEQTIERALDVIYEESNHMDLKILEWRHSINDINSSNN